MQLRVPLPAAVWIVALVAGYESGLAFAAQPEESSHRWFSLPIEVSGLPAGAQGVPVSCTIDFTDILKRLNVAGVVDEHSLRLYRNAAAGSEVEEPVQFSASPQPGPRARRILPGTTPGVSYGAEHPAQETPPGPRVAGSLAWLVSAGADGKQTYRLRFGVPRSGRSIHVPFPPQNLRAFDAQGRAMPIACFPVMQIHPQWPLDGMLHLFDGRQLVTSYHVGPPASQFSATGSGPAPSGPLPSGPAPSGVRRPFLYPVIGPDGVPLTDFGKPHDPTGSHSHHYSLWIAHNSVAGREFWSDRGGVIAHDRWELLEDGPVFCRVVQGTRWIFDQQDVLRERRSWTLYRAAGDSRLLDVELEFTPSASKAVELGKTSFGFLAIRVAQSMTPFDGGGEILNARGDRNEQAAHLKHAEWLDQSGPIAPGEPNAVDPLRAVPPRWGGIAMLDHPENANHPTGWHCRNDGWAGASFCLEKPYTIQPGEKLRLRYRIHLHRGNAVEGKVASQYEAYRAKPVVRLGTARP